MTTNEIIENLKSMRASIDSMLSELEPKTEPVKRTRGRVCARSTSSDKNPVCVENGRNSGKYTAGIPKAKHSKRPRGTVNVKSMTLEEKRAYWRWSSTNRARRRRLAKLEAAFDESVKNGGGCQNG